MKNNRTTALLMLLVFLLVVAVVIIFLTGLDRSSARENPYETVTTTAEPIASPETPPPAASTEPAPAATSAPVYYSAATAAPVSTASPGSAAVSHSTPSPAAPTPTPTPAPTPTQAPTDADGNPLFSAQDLIPVVPGATTSSSGSSDSPAASIPVGTSIGNGSFRSDTGTGLNIHADWSAVISGQETVDITVTVYADCYSLYTTATPNALNIALGGQYVSLASPAIERDGTGGAASVEINSRTFSVPLVSGEFREIPLDVAWQYRGSYSGVNLDTIECGGNIVLNR